MGQERRLSLLWELPIFGKADQLKSWKADLKENSTYVMHNFKVVKNDGQFRVCEHEYKLVFIGVTVVKEADLHQLPFKEFRFVEFGNVVGGNFVAGLLVGEPSHRLCFHFDHHFFFLSLFYLLFFCFKFKIQFKRELWTLRRIPYEKKECTMNICIWNFE